MVQPKESTSASLKKRKYLYLAIIFIVFILVDLAIFKYVSYRPLGLDPSDPEASPELNTWEEAAPLIKTPSAPGEPLVLVPAVQLEETTASGASQFEVLGFGREKNTMYLFLRLHESIDLSLDKGWGRAFQIKDSAGKNHLFDPHLLPNAVDISDSFVDLPNDLRAKQTVLAGNFRELVLAFPDFPKNRFPESIRIIEAFHGESPANPGNVFAEALIKRTGKMRTSQAVTGMKPGEIRISSNFQPLPGMEGAEIGVSKLLVDNSYMTEVVIDISGSNDAEISVSDAVLIDETGNNYNMFCLKKLQSLKTADSSSGSGTLYFEPLAETAKPVQVWVVVNYKGAASEILLDL